MRKCTGCGINWSSPRCESARCCYCCTPECLGCDFHRLAAEFACIKLSSEDATTYQSRLGAIQAAGIVDYGPFIQSISGASDDTPGSPPRSTRQPRPKIEDLVQPVPSTRVGVAAALRTSFRGDSPVPPRVVHVGTFNTPALGESSSVAESTIVFMTVPMYDLPGALVNTYRNCCKDRYRRSTFIRKFRLTPCTAVAQTQAPSSSDAVVFGDDDSNQVSRVMRPTKQLLHEFSVVGGPSVRFASCSCSPDSQQRVERLASVAYSRGPAGLRNSMSHLFFHCP